MAPNEEIHKEIENPNEFLSIPKWINKDYFVSILEKDIPEYKCITKFSPIAATAPGENYASVMVRVVIDVELKDDTSQQISYILKTVLDSGDGANYVSSMNLFPKEKHMYTCYLPQFEKLYRNAGIDVKIGPKCLHFDEASEKITLVMEDLKRDEFYNMDRLKGFDMEHMVAVLHKLAEFHAASAVYQEQNGPYEEFYHTSFYNENNRSMLAQLYDPLIKLFKKAMADWGLPEVEKYVEKTLTCDEIFEQSTFINTSDPTEFNVLNHGDCWSNNIMFKHDESGKVQKILFIDFQVCKWGSPAQDLWYLITTSANLDIKIKEFDNFVQIYHKRLVECLQLLKYQKCIPSLKELHIMMLKYGYWGVFTANGVAPVILYPSDKEANMDNFLKPGPEADAFRFKTYTNPIYVRAMLQFYPFLYNKGLFDHSTRQ